MASRNFSNVQAIEKELKIVFGEFTWNSTTVTKVDGDGYTVAHSATGKAIVTLDDKYVDLYPLSVHVANSTVVDDTQHFGAISVANSTVEIWNYNQAGSAAGDLGGETVYFAILCKNTTAI